MKVLKNFEDLIFLILIIFSNLQFLLIFIYAENVENFEHFEFFKFFNIMQIKQKMVLNVMSISLTVTKNSPSRRSRNYLSNEGSPNSVSFTVSEIKQKKKWY